MKFTSNTTTHRRIRRRLSSLVCLLLVLTLLPLAALASGIPNSMRVALISPRELMLHPLLINDRDMLSMLDLVYESVVTLNDARQPEPQLCTSWEKLSDGRTWKFYIRDDVKFHDGRDLTAYDIAATMDAIRSIANDTSRAANQKGIYSLVPTYFTSWKAEDARTLTVQTDRPYYGVLYAMTFPVLQAQSVLQENPPGTGPYRVSYYSPGEELWLTANPGWAGPVAYVSELVGQWYDTPEQALAAYEAEQVDIVMTRSTAAVRYRGTTNSRASSYDYATQQLECLLINNTGVLRDVGVREAIAYAIDKNRIIGSVYQNMVTTTETLQPTISWLYPDDPFSYDYLPEKANSILDSLKWDSYNSEGHRIKRNESGEATVLEVRLNYYDEADNGLRKETANEIAAMLRAVGFRVIVSGMDFEAAQTKLKPTVRDYHLFLCAFNFDSVPDPYFLLHSSSDANSMGYRSDDMNKLVTALRKADEADTFKQTWLDIQTQLAKDLPLLPLYWRNGVLLTRYPFTSVRDIREYELLKSINLYNR